MRPIDANKLVVIINNVLEDATSNSMPDVVKCEICKLFLEIINEQPTIDAIPVEWLNERHRKCCEEGDTDLMDAITVLCNEYHVWQKEQEAQDG